MTDAVLTSSTAFPPGTSDAEIEAAAARAARNRYHKVLFWRWAILLVILGGWELGARLGIIDEFFFSSPSAIWSRLVEWTIEGTSEGPLWLHLYVTMEEAMLGFAIGSVTGITVGIARAVGTNQDGSGSRPTTWFCSESEKPHQAVACGVPIGVELNLD